MTDTYNVLVGGFVRRRVCS